MIGSILMCDKCGESVRVGAIPCGSGSQTRLAANRGTIRRVRIGRTYWNSTHRGIYPGRPVSEDLCGRCNRPEVIASRTIDETHRAARFGGVFVPEGMTLCGCQTGAVWATGRERNTEHVNTAAHVLWVTR